MTDVTALGELLIDFTPSGVSEHGAALYARNAGGAPANVLAMLSRLGRSTQLIARVGQDAFGRFLRDTLEQCGVGCRGIVTGPEATTLAFVQLDKTGERSFAFHRGADLLLTAEQVPVELIKRSRVFHFGSVSMTGEPGRGATLFAARTARAAGVLVSYDPNYRPVLWPDTAAAVKVMAQGLAYARIVKVSDEEALLLTGEREPGAAAQALRQLGPELVLVTAGGDGAWYAGEGFSGHVPAFHVPVVDTTGAGDTFLGAFLHALLRHPGDPLRELDEPFVRGAVTYASAAGALCTTDYGAIAAMPAEKQIQTLLTGEEG